MTIAHSAAVGAYPPFPVLQPEGVVYSTQIDSPQEIFVQMGKVLKLIDAFISNYIISYDRSDVDQPNG